MWPPSRPSAPLRGGKTTCPPACPRSRAASHFTPMCPRHAGPEAAARDPEQVVLARTLAGAGKPRVRHSPNKCPLNWLRASGTPLVQLPLACCSRLSAGTVTRVVLAIRARRPHLSSQGRPSTEPHTPSGSHPQHGLQPPLGPCHTGTSEAPSRGHCACPAPPGPSQPQLPPPGGASALPQRLQPQ